MTSNPFCNLFIGWQGTIRNRGIMELFFDKENPQTVPEAGRACGFLFVRQSPERKSANRRKDLAKSDEMVYAYAYRRRDGVYVVPIGCLKN